METLLSWAVGTGLVLDLGMALSGRRKQRSELRGCEGMSVYLLRQCAVALFNSRTYSRRRLSRIPLLKQTFLQ